MAEHAITRAYRGTPLLNKNRSKDLFNTAVKSDIYIYIAVTF